MKEKIEAIRHDVFLVLTDPECDLSDGAKAALRYVMNELEALAEQPAPVREDWGPGPHEHHSLPVREPEPPTQPASKEELKRLKSFLLALPEVREALAEQPAQQEPVAVVSGYYGGQCVVLPINPARLFNSGAAFYTTPQAQPAREPLTDEQINKAAEDEDNETAFLVGFYAGARFAEAAHGITKGNAS